MDFTFLAFRHPFHGLWWKHRVAQTRIGMMSLPFLTVRSKFPEPQAEIRRSTRRCMYFFFGVSPTLSLPGGSLHYSPHLQARRGMGLTLTSFGLRRLISEFDGSIMILS